MCTVSVITRPSGLRLVTNRDVPRSRSTAHPPTWREGGLHRAIWPTDPDGGGTWIGASQSGLVLCLLNLNPIPAPPADDSLTSRGVIIPDLIDHGDAASAMRALQDLDLGSFAPFRLIAADIVEGDVRVLEAEWHEALTSREHSTPACFVSSGLGDSRVLPRLPLFDDRVREGDAIAQDCFHRHQWPGRPEISVLMSRADARTVSITTVELTQLAEEALVHMSHEPVPDKTPAELAEGKSSIMPS